MLSSRLSTFITWLRRQLAYASKATLMLSCPGQLEKKTEFLRFISETGSDRKKVLGGILLCAPRPIQRYMDHSDRTSFTEVRSSSLFICLLFLFVTLMFRILKQATGQSFRPVKLQIFFGKVQGPTCQPFWKLGGWDPPKGPFCPPQNVPDNKKSCS